MMCRSRWHNQHASFEATRCALTAVHFPDSRTLAADESPAEPLPGHLQTLADAVDSLLVTEPPAALFGRHGSTKGSNCSSLVHCISVTHYASTWALWILVDGGTLTRTAATVFAMTLGTLAHRSLFWSNLPASLDCRCTHRSGDYSQPDAHFRTTSQQK